MNTVKTQKFSLGQIVATPGALEALAESGQTADLFLQKHHAGDWGCVDDEDWQANNQPSWRAADSSLRTKR